jgi:DNA helicase II / ATP-dependent DNA helicase PcrA
MKLNEVFSNCSFKPNDHQEIAIKTTEGPLLVSAGPGSGKTEVLIYRTLNLMLCKDIEPKNILLCTFTEKAVEQLKSRLKLYLSKCRRESLDLSRMSCGTIHSICNEIILDHINDINEIVGLNKNFAVLEELTQVLFIFENFEEIFGEKIDGKYLFKWTGKWDTIKKSIPFFNKITEECIDVDLLRHDVSLFIKLLSGAYSRYKQKLIDTNHIDFSFQQRHVYDLLLHNEKIREKLQDRYKYLMIDEYQDTNYVQEQIMLMLAQKHNNICVVGDDDQSLYRFRGATVRNILEFPSKFSQDIFNKEKLYTNYRSYKKIISAYNDFMNSDVWYEQDKEFRFPKKILPNKEDKRFKLDYPSVLKIQHGTDNPSKVADLIIYLKENKIISDLNQVAFFMRSIKLSNIKSYIEEFDSRGIPYYAPRAKKFFENKEIKEIIAGFIRVLSFEGDEIKDQNQFKGLAEYCDQSYEEFKDNCYTNPDYLNLAKYLDNKGVQIKQLKEGKALEEGLIDIFYKILSFKPFADYLEDDSSARNLAIFSRLVVLFQQYYKVYVITAGSLKKINYSFFLSYLRFLLLNGLNEHEDPYDIFPSGKVQIMTIHQSKGLEFPVVFVAGLEKRNPPEEIVDKHLAKYYNRKEFEPAHKIQDFDQMRLSYVAFSRAEDLLILVSQRNPFRYYGNIFNTLPDIDSINFSQLKLINTKSKKQKTQKLEFGFTSHINVYDICPRQYLMYKEYDFTPARNAQIVFGSLVHETIEDIHRHILDKNPLKLTEEKILDYFERNKQGYIKRGIQIFNEEAAKKQILNYFNNNKEEIARVKETEFEVVVDQEDYYLKGILDLITGEDGKVDILDFKSQKRPEDESKVIDNYRKQLAVYSYIVEKKRKIKPDKTIIYWTGEEDKSRAWMEIDTQDAQIREVMSHFEDTVHKIRNKEFKVMQKPDRRVCNDCDFKHCCEIRQI